MNVLVFLIPVSILIGLIWLVSFLWAARKGQFDDPKGNASRVLNDDYDDKPKS